jgi:hypothetical protein
MVSLIGFGPEIWDLLGRGLRREWQVILWCNELTILASFARQLANPNGTLAYQAAAEDVHRALAARLWFEESGYLYDVIDSPKASAPGTARCGPMTWPSRAPFEQRLCRTDQRNFRYHPPHVPRGSFARGLERRGNVTLLDGIQPLERRISGCGAAYPSNMHRSRARSIK